MLQYKKICIALTLATALPVILGLVVQGSPTIAKEPAKNKTTMLKGSINELLVLCSYAGITLDKESVPANITKVKLGTPAAYFGAAENDRVLAASIQNNQLSLKIERGAKKFTLMLPISASALRAATGAGANTPIDIKSHLLNLTVAVDEKNPKAIAFKLLCEQKSKNLPPAKEPSQFQDIRALKDYDIVVLVDHSGSMTARITGDHVSETSKWEWIQSQVKTTTNEFSKTFKKGIKLVMFADDYRIYDNCMPTDIPSIFLGAHAYGGNVVIPPLRAVLTQKINSGRPTIICIITDGEKLCDYTELRRCIHNAIKATPGKYDLSINFLIVNSGTFDTELQNLKSDLLKEGATLDIVNLRSFDEVKDRGLTNVLIDYVTP